MITDISYSTYC